VDLIASSAKGQIIRVPLKSISSLGRATQGVRVMRLNAADKIAATAVL
jgi:DNA gyrase subunit A